MKIAFVPFSVRCPQHKNTGSIRIRVHWIIKHLENAVIANDPRETEDADVVIFQKAYGPIINLKALRLKSKGKIIVFDLCDPEWYMLADPSHVFEMMNLAHQIVVPTEKMKELVEQKTSTPVCVIEDSMDLDYHNKFKQDHSEKEIPTLVWFGNRGTFKAFKSYIPELEEVYRQVKFKVKIISDNETIKEDFEMKIPFEFVEWKLETVNEEIMKCDVAINPKLDDVMDYPKSNNKTLTAWACGLPCVEVWAWTETKKWKLHLIELLSNWETRKREGKIGRTKIEEEYDSRMAAKKWEKLCYYLLKEKTNDSKNINTNAPSERE